MKYVSLDLETSGLNEYDCQILEISAVIDDLFTPLDKLPVFSKKIYWETINFENEACKLHIKSGFLQEYYDCVTKNDDIDTVFSELFQFLKLHLGENEKWNFAGKNLVSFDLKFFRQLSCVEHVNEITNMIHHRIIDPSVFFTDFINDKHVLSLQEVKYRAGVNGAVTHFSLSDAMDVVKIIREIAKQNSCKWLQTNNA